MTTLSVLSPIYATTRYTRMDPRYLSVKVADICLGYDSYYKIGTLEGKIYFPNVVNVRCQSPFKCT